MLSLRAGINTKLPSSTVHCTLLSCSCIKQSCYQFITNFSQLNPLFILSEGSLIATEFPICSATNINSSKLVSKHNRGHFINCSLLEPCHGQKTRKRKNSIKIYKVDIFGKSIHNLAYNTLKDSHFHSSLLPLIP